MPHMFPAFAHHTPPTRYGRYHRERVVSIAEADFWSSLKVRGGPQAAVHAGRAGRRKRAYALLAGQHAETLADLGEEYERRVRIRLSNPAARRKANTRPAALRQRTSQVHGCAAIAAVVAHLGAT